MKTGEMTIRIQFDEMKSVFNRILLKNGFSVEKAETCAVIFAVNSLEGVVSHGVNRFPRFVSNVRDGFVIPGNDPVPVKQSGAIEQWDGKLGPGPLNALIATDRAVEIAREHGIGMVALSNTNHWMRAGYYGWHAAGKGYILMGWTNTDANMPAWGAREARLGNNPMVFAVPYENKAIVLDFAMTQFSYGKMETYRMAGEKLPFPGGFNSSGEMTDDPSGILEARRPLPIGYWKGAGLSLVLDILAVALTGGRSVKEITMTGTEYGLSQVFIAIDPNHLANFATLDDSIRRIIEDYKLSPPADSKTAVRYPGERIAELREENLRKGIVVLKEVWEMVSGLESY
jgi:3-dehydro-L-gulonate 2-dehydrogenase